MYAGKVKEKCPATSGTRTHEIGSRTQIICLATIMPMVQLSNHYVNQVWDSLIYGLTSLSI